MEQPSLSRTDEDAISPKISMMLEHAEVSCYCTRTGRKTFYCVLDIPDYFKQTQLLNAFLYSIPGLSAPGRHTLTPLDGPLQHMNRDSWTSKSPTE